MNLKFHLKFLKGHSQSQSILSSSNFPANQINSSNINDLLASTASSITLNKAITSNPTFNNLAAALNLNLSLQQQQQQQHQQQQQQQQQQQIQKQNQSGLPLKKSFHSPLVAAVAVAQSLQSFQNSKKTNSLPASSLQAPLPTSAPTAASATNANFTFLNSFNATQLQQIPSEWQFNQAFKSRDTLNAASTSIENLLANGAIAGSKSYEIWNKIKSNHECNGNLSTSHEDSIKAISLIDEAAATFKKSSALFNSELSQAFSKLKNQQAKEQVQDCSAPPNMTMINVENLNFYTSIDGESPRFASNHELSCSGCMRNSNPSNQYNNSYYIHQQQQQQQQQQTEMPLTASSESHVNCTQTTAAAAATAAAVAMNIAKLLTNNSQNLVQTKNDNSHSVFVSNFQNKSQLASQQVDIKQQQRLTKSMENLQNLEMRKPSNTVHNEAADVLIKTENNKSKPFEIDEDSVVSMSSLSSAKDKSKNISLTNSKNSSERVRKDSCNQLSCSCRIKLEPECMNITSDPPNNEHRNCGENIQQIEVKLSPGKVNILKKKSNHQDNNCESDSELYSEMVRSCSSSSSGSLVRLVVDEASSILEPSDSNLSKAKKNETAEIKLAKTESIDKDNLSDSNFVTDVSKDNNSSSTRFFFSNKNCSDETNLDKNASDDSNRNPAKKVKRWTFCQSESNDVN